MITVSNNKNITKCPKCSNVLTFDNSDVKENNQGA